MEASEKITLGKELRVLWEIQNFMINIFSIIFGKTLIFLSNNFNLGSGSTWPGHIALKLNKKFIKDILKGSKIKVIVVAGTNGKTTTSRLITSLIRENENTYLQNKAGANLVNGLASTLIKGSSLGGKLNKDYLIFESDESALPRVLEEANPDYIVALNLFRDQLDRYGEVDSIARKWSDAFEKLTDKTTLILNADDPLISYLGNKSKANISYFGLEKSDKKNLKHGADSTHCPKCREKLEFTTVFFSHLGIWKCPKCKLERPKPDLNELPSYPLAGNYNKYNALAAVLFAKRGNINEEKITSAFANFTPAFGRQEKLKYKGKDVQIFLSKNPTSFNESLETIKEFKGENLFIIFNDRIPDGLDVSWIWDINFEELLTKNMHITLSGDRVYDMALRLKYTEIFVHSFPTLEEALNKAVDALNENETLYILPNYSAMLDIRKIITGKKIL